MNINYSEIPAWETHWFQLKDSFLVELKDNLLNELVQKGINKAGNLNQLCVVLDFSVPTFYNLINKKGIKMISVKKLKRLLNYLNIDFDYLDDKIEMTKKGRIISITDPKFPINLNNKYGAYLLGLIVSDGCLYFDKKARNQIRTKYAAGEKDSEENFTNVINELYGKVHINREFIRNCAILKIGTSIVGDSLLKTGAIAGRKAMNDCDVPWLIKEGTKEMKASYLRAVFDDESSVYKEKNRDQGYITLSRYRHLSNLTDKQKEELKKLDSLMLSRKFPTGHISKTITIKKALRLLEDHELIMELNKPSKLLQGESELLNEFGVKTRLFGRYLTRTHLGRYSLCFDLFINRKDSLKKFYKHIGYSLNRKQKKLIQLVGGENAARIVQYINEKKRTI